MQQRLENLVAQLRRLLCALLLLPLAAGGASAQETVAPSTLDQLFVKLAQLQQANVFVARQMSETQLRAAAVLQSLIDDGGVTDPAQLEIVATFAANARTLATVMLSPVATQQVATGDSMRRLVRRNLLLLERARPVVAANDELTAAFEQYSALQLQMQDLTVALENGWVRYGETLRTAQLTGMLEPGAFDPTEKRWAIATPDVELPPAAVADEEPTAPPAPPTIGLTELPPIGSGAPRLPESEDGVDITVLEDGSVQIGAWTVIETTGIVSASAPNRDAATAPLVSALVIDCRPNGTLQYLLPPGGDGVFRVHTDEIDYQVVRATGGIISGADALTMSDTLRRAFENAASRGGEAPLTLALADQPDLRTQFPVDGYLEARGRVLYACAPWTPENPTTESALLQAADGTSGSVSGAGAGASAAEPSEAQIAPVPRPRPARRNAGDTPLDIM